MRVRDASATDAAACAAIYAPYVRDTAISFELEVPTPDEMATRIATAQTRWAWLVIEHRGRVIGYAYGGSFRSRAAYRFSCEVSVYVQRDRARAGAGRALYAELLARLAALGFRTATAGMTLPNPASEGFHRAMGFAPVGVFHTVGFKLGRWHDVAWMQRSLGEGEPPAEDDATRATPEPPAPR